MRWNKIGEGEEYHELEEEQVLFDGADLIPYVSEIQEKIAEYRPCRT